jgi:hypothetical protein
MSAESTLVVEIAVLERDRNRGAAVVGSDELDLGAFPSDEMCKLGVRQFIARAFVVLE